MLNVVVVGRIIVYLKIVFIIVSGIEFLNVSNFFLCILKFIIEFVKREEFIMILKDM